MTVKVFCGEKFSEHESEWNQFKEVYNLIKDKYEGKEEPVYILADFRLANSQIDVAILMKRGIIIIDLKSYEGEIKGSENGDWKVITDSAEIVPLYKNLFTQLGTQKYGLSAKLKDIGKDNFRHIEERKLNLIQAWGYFENGSTFDREQIGRAAWPWFDVVWKDTFLEKLGHFTKPGYTLYEKDMEAIRKGLNLKEYDIFGEKIRRPPMALRKDDRYYETKQSYYLERLAYDKKRQSDFIRLVRNEANLKNYEKALEYAEKALEKDTYNPNAWLIKGIVLKYMNKIEESFKCFDEAVRIEPGYVEGLTFKGIALGYMGKFQEALECFDEAVRIEPENVDALCDRGRVLKDMYKFEEAIECIDEAVRIEPENVDAWVIKGDVLFLMRKYQEAIGCYDEVLRIDPENVSVLNNKGMGLVSMGNYEEAIECYKEALKIEPKDDFALIGKCDALHWRGNYEEAIECFDAALKIKPKNRFAWNGKGLVLCSMSRYEDAIECHNEALKIDPEDNSALINKGVALGYIGRHQDMGKFQEALECFDEALEIEPRNWVAWNKKGGVFNFMGKYKEALECYDEALKIDPGNVDVRIGKGLAFGRMSNYEEATECFDEALKIDPENVDVRNVKEAVLLKSLFELDDTDPKFWFKKAEIMDGMGKHEAAKKCYVRAAEMEEKSEEKDTVE